MRRGHGPGGPSTTRPSRRCPAVQLQVSRATVRRAGGESILTPNQAHDPMRSQGQRDSDEWRRRGQAAAGVPRQHIRRPNGVGGGAPEWVARPLKLTYFVNFVNLAIYRASGNQDPLRDRRLGASGGGGMRLESLAGVAAFRGAFPLPRAGQCPRVCGCGTAGSFRGRRARAACAVPRAVPSASPRGPTLQPGAAGDSGTKSWPSSSCTGRS